MGAPEWYEILQGVVDAMKPYARHGLNVNVDFYSGVVYQLHGIPMDLYVPIFAIGRMPGWIIQCLEQQRGNILIRGVGSLKAKNRSLAEVHADITRILIGKGLTPNFQLEVTGFESKKAFVTFPNPSKNLGNNIVPITNLPITLKELQSISK